MLARNKKLFILFLGVFTVILAIPFLLFAPGKKEEIVVIYVSQDQDYAQPILEEFEKETGIKVIAFYDTEATKGVSLVNRLLLEKNNPKADVYWNNEPIRTILLKENDILEPYCPINAKDIPPNFKDPNCYWIGFASRARVIIFNTNLVSEEEAPKSIFDFTNPKWKGKVCIANPFFGSTQSHFAAILALLGEERFKEYLQKLKENEVKIVASNSMVRDLVVSGECWVGLTDTDDAYDAIKEGKPVKMILPDQDYYGTFFFPNTVMLIKGSKNKENAKKLIEYLLSPKVEEKLEELALQIPLKSSSKIFKKELLVFKNATYYSISFEKVYQNLNKSQEIIKALNFVE